MLSQELCVELGPSAMLTSVGHDTATACAAIRAGLSRPGPLHDIQTANIAEPETVPLLGHPLVPITNGFSGLGRWLQMGRQVLGEMESCVRRSDRFTLSQDSTLHLLLPAVDGPRFSDDEFTNLERVHSHLVPNLLAGAPLGFDPGRVRVHARGRVGLADVLLEVQQAGAPALLVALDSYVDTHTLLWLGQAGRLKDDHNPVGLMPGEAAVAIGLSVPRRGEAAQGPVVTRVATAEDEERLERALTWVLREVAQSHVGELYTDLNGESWIAEAYVVALEGLQAFRDRTLELQHAASQVGDIGEAATALNLAIAHASLQPHRTTHESAFVAATDIQMQTIALRMDRHLT